MKDNLENEILGNEDLLEEDLGGVSDDDILDELFAEDDTSEEIDSNNEQEIIDNEELESIKLEEQLEKTNSLIEEEDTIIEDGTENTTKDNKENIEDCTGNNEEDTVAECTEDIEDTVDAVEDNTEDIENVVEGNNNEGTNENEDASTENKEDDKEKVENIEDGVVEDKENVDKDTGTKETVQEIKEDIKNSDKDIDNEEAVQEIKEDIKNSDKDIDNEEAIQEIKEDTELNEEDDTEDEESVAVVTKEEKKKKSIVPVIILLILAVLGAIITFILNNRTIVVNEDKHIKLAEDVPVVSDGSIELSKDNSGIVAPTKEFELIPMGDDEHIKSDLGELGDKPLMASIVTKIDLGQGEKRYAGNIFIGQGKTIYGYEKIKAAIKEFNTNSTEIIKIPDKPKKDSHTDLVLVRFAVKISEDFPVEDIYNKVVNIKPRFDLDIEGKLENDLYSFGLPSFTSMYKYNEIKAGDTIQVGFIAFMPFDIKADKYKLKLRISDKLNEENKLNIDIKSFDTPKEK